jgi:hypothetical protein
MKTWIEISLRILGLSCLICLFLWMFSLVRQTDNNQQSKLSDSLRIEVMKREIVLKDMQIVREKRYIENLTHYSK